MEIFLFNCGTLGYQTEWKYLYFIMGPWINRWHGYIPLLSWDLGLLPVGMEIFLYYHGILGIIPTKV
jgi:hypothetical protein